MMTGSEKKAVAAIALLYSTRMLGLFMVLPVFAIAGQGLEGASSMLIGVAVGAYGLSQALLQIPFGALSDRFGRKPIILFGLLLFFLGSVIAALSDHIYGVILGRFLQGAGAIASVLMALVSDLTTEESRTKSMAMIGMSIGISFSLALILGPLIVDLAGLSGIFWVTAFLAGLGMVWLIKIVPSPVTLRVSRDTHLFRDQLIKILANAELLRLDFGILVLHLCLTAMFLAIPISLSQQLGMTPDTHWWIYLSVLMLSFVAMLPFIIIGEKKRKMKPVFIAAISLLALSAMAMVWTQNNFNGFWASLFVFFLGFNLLEASLPSLVSKTVPAGGRGTAMGVYSTSQFFGAFIGGIIGGYMASQFGVDGVYWSVVVLVLLWLFAAFGMKNPRAETGLTIKLKNVQNADNAESVLQDLKRVPGVKDAVVVIEDAIAYLKIDKDQFSESDLPAAWVQPD